MDVSATLNDGTFANIVDIDINGSDIYITYVDESSNFKLKKEIFFPRDGIFTLGSSATVN